jgi:hypothetical protein
MALRELLLRVDRVLIGPRIPPGVMQHVEPHLSPGETIRYASTDTEARARLALQKMCAFLGNAFVEKFVVNRRAQIAPVRAESSWRFRTVGGHAHQDQCGHVCHTQDGAALQVTGIREMRSSDPGMRRYLCVNVAERVSSLTSLEEYLNDVDYQPELHFVLDPPPDNVDDRIIKLFDSCFEQSKSDGAIQPEVRKIYVFLALLDNRFIPHAVWTRGDMYKWLFEKGCWQIQFGEQPTVNALIQFNFKDSSAFAWFMVRYADGRTGFIWRSGLRTVDQFRDLFVSTPWNNADAMDVCYDTTFKGWPALERR